MKRTHLSRTKWFDLLFRAYRRKESASTRTSGSRALSAGEGGKRIPSSDKVTTHDPAWDFLKVFSQLLEVQARPWPTWPSGNKSIVNPTARSWSYFCFQILKSCHGKMRVHGQRFSSLTFWMLHFKNTISPQVYLLALAKYVTLIRSIWLFCLCKRSGRKAARTGTAAEKEAASVLSCALNLTARCALGSGPLKNSCLPLCKSFRKSEKCEIWRSSQRQVT